MRWRSSRSTRGERVVHSLDAATTAALIQTVAGARDAVREISAAWLGHVSRSRTRSVVERVTAAVSIASAMVGVSAAVAGGVWTLREYYHFRRESEALQLEQARLAVRQTEAEAARIVAETERTRAETQRSHVEQSLAQEQLDDLQETRASRNARRVEFEERLAILPMDGGGQTRCRVSWRLTVHNRSHSELRIDLAYVAVFVARRERTTSLLRRGRTRISRIAAPPGPLEELRSQTGFVAWDRLMASLHVHASRSHEAMEMQEDLAADADQIVTGGGNTAHLNQDERSESTYQYIVECQPGDLIAVRAELFTNTMQPGDVWRAATWDAVPGPPPAAAGRSR